MGQAVGEGWEHKVPLLIENVAITPPQLKCWMQPCKLLSADLASLLSGQVQAFGHW